MRGSLNPGCLFCSRYFPGTTGHTRTPGAIDPVPRMPGSGVIWQYPCRTGFLVFRKVFKKSSFYRSVLFLSCKVPDNVPEKLPVQEQVDDTQGGEHEARVVVHRNPLVAGNTGIGRPTLPSNLLGGAEEGPHHNN